MKLKERIYHAITQLFPQKFKVHLKQLSIYAGESININIYLGTSAVIGLLAFIAVLLIPYALGTEYNIKYFFFAALAFFLVIAAFYLMIYFKAEDRTRRVEDVLPDALQLIAANIRAGMTPYQALNRAARKEFGPLEDEIKSTTSRALGVESFPKLLLDISTRIKSELLERAMELFTTAIRSGGHLVKLLEELAKDAEETRGLKKELVTSTKTYIAFIMFTIIIGAPLLLAISIQFIDVITGMQSKTDMSQAGFGMGFLAGEVGITADFMIKISIVMLLITSLLAAILLGTIVEGKPKYGFKYAPIIIIGSLVVFAVSRYIIGNFFGGL